MYRPKISTEQNPRMATSSTSSATLSSGTMASLTKAKEPTRSYSNRFSEQTRIRNDPNYVPPQKSVNISSEDDFPSLGPNVTSVTSVSTSVNTNVTSVTKSWSSSKDCIKMAEEWGKKNEEDERANRARIIKAEDDRRRIAKEQMKEEKKQKMNVKEETTKSKLIIRETNKDKFYDQYEHKFKNIEEIEEDSFESGPSHDEEEFIDDDDVDEEFNADISYERRNKGELHSI